jgi:hypothetical protein
VRFVEIAVCVFSFVFCGREFGHRARGKKRFVVMVMRSVVLLLLSVIVAAAASLPFFITAAAADEQHVVALTAKTFDDAVGKDKAALVEFYAPW